jgi:hypothetical protein
MRVYVCADTAKSQWRRRKSKTYSSSYDKRKRDVSATAHFKKKGVAAGIRRFLGSAERLTLPKPS